jgi:hypothetical protein
MIYFDLLVYYHVMYIKLVMKYLSLCQLFYEFQQPILVLDDGAAEQLHVPAASSGTPPSAQRAHLAW